MKIYGWGGYPTINSSLIVPFTQSDFIKTTGSESIPRGMGRSYGDSANAYNVVQTSNLDHFISFDSEKGLLNLEAGVMLREILEISVPKGWFLPVTPGTSYVTVGGAIASDVHGKNHHLAGTFCDHVHSMMMLLGSGDIVKVSREEHSDLFHATCGGMGLTGIILSATICLIHIPSSYIDQEIIKKNSLEDVCDAFEKFGNSSYSVAWIDCIKKGKDLGRSLLITGEHADLGGYALNLNQPVKVPFHSPSVFLNRYSVTLFNNLYYLKAVDQKKSIVPMSSFFYPLDRIGSWNRLYGMAGFLQYQFVIPKEDGVKNLRKLMTLITESGEASFLAVLKQFGRANHNLLSFPQEGYTLALDFKVSEKVFKLLERLDELVLEMGGRIYLTKDARMSERTFKQSYPRWSEFESIRSKYHAIGKYASSQSKRLGLA